MIKPYNAHEAQGNAVLQVELRFLLPCNPNDLAPFFIFLVFFFFQVLAPMTRFVLDLLLLLLVVKTKQLRDKELCRRKRDIQ